MTEPRPIYTPRPRRDDPDANAAAIIEDTRREMTNRALDDAGATERGLLALVAEVARLRDLVALGTRHAHPRAPAAHAWRDLRRTVAAWGGGRGGGL